MYISDFFIFGKLTEWRCFVTYLSNDPRISPIWGKAPAEWIEMKVCNAVDLGDVIMDVKFKFENIRDFDVIRGQSSPFPTDCERGPYHSAALPCCLWYLPWNTLTLTLCSYGISGHVNITFINLHINLTMKTYYLHHGSIKGVFFIFTITLAKVGK